MTIRRATAGDIPAIDRLLSQVLDIHHAGRPDLFRGGVRKYTDEQLTALLADENRPVLAAFDENGAFCGYAFCIFEQHIDHNILTDVKTLYIDDLCVDETCRGQHVGRTLFEAVCALAREQGCYNVTLNVWSCNDTARRFYEAMGMHEQKIGMETIL